MDFLQGNSNEKKKAEEVSPLQKEEPTDKVDKNLFTRNDQPMLTKTPSVTTRKKPNQRVYP